MQELSQKLEGVETVDPPSLSRRIRREFPDLTSPQTESASRQLLSEIRRKLDLRVRACLGDLVPSRGTRSKPHDFKGKLSRAIVRLRVLAY